jgi:hypothetical protein
MRLASRRRILRRIERQLVDSDLDLFRLFFDFNWRMQGQAMPTAEKIRPAPMRVIFRGFARQG